MNRDAFAEIFDLYAPAIYNYAYRLYRDPLLADQVVGEVFAELSEHLSTGRSPILNLRAYLYGLAYHSVAGEVQDSQRLELAHAVDVRHYVPNSADTSAEKQALFEAAMRAIMNDLKDAQRHVIILRFMEGMSLKETAGIVGKKINTVKVTQNRAITALHKSLDRPVQEINGALRSFNYLQSLRVVYPRELFAARRAARSAPPGGVFDKIYI